tara:strand:+ start:2254 stop:2643 length:390 start_codon:yes stop_codon:yes gene_type:complete
LEVNNIKSLLFISLGAIVGSNIRFLIYERLGNIFFLRKELRILIINNFASFLLGLYYSISINQAYINYSKNISLLFSIGFLGSLSTFSTFVYDLFELSFQRNFFKSVKFLIFTISLGLFSLWLGLLIGN